jgi:hypothetical protein
VGCKLYSILYRCIDVTHSRDGFTLEGFELCNANTPDQGPLSPAPFVLSSFYSLLFFFSLPSSVISLAFFPRGHLCSCLRSAVLHQGLHFHRHFALIPDSCNQHAELKRRAPWISLL